MMRSLYSGVSGLKTHQTKMDVIGNNIANVNTVAFKSSSTTFKDIMYQTTQGASGATANTGGKNPNQIGLGVSTGSTKVSITSAGAAQSTGEAFDIKLTDSNNTNFFIVSNGTETLFTRAGSFYVDGNGNLCMSSTGYMVMGWQVNDDGTAIVKDNVSALRIMQASNLTSAPEATSKASVTGIVDKNDSNVAGDGYYLSLNFYDKEGYSYAAKFAVKDMDSENGTYSVELINIYDSSTPQKDILADYLDAAADKNAALGDLFGDVGTATQTCKLKGGYTVSTAYADSLEDKSGNVISLATQNANGKYDVVDPTTNTVVGEVSLSEVCGFADGKDYTGVQIKDNKIVVSYDAAYATLQFNSANGTFDFIGEGKKTGDTINLNMTVLGKTYGNPTENQFENIEIDFTQCLNYDNGGTSTLGIEKGDTTGTQGVGKKLGAMIGLSIDQTGKIYGSYDNGNTVLLGQIAVAQFANASGLESVGNSCYATTLNSGEFDGIGVDVTADGGSMNTGQLEMSNVDLSAEFTEMIVTQRGFQANSRIITVSDTLLEELTNLKR